jgi:hypothetical protein
MLIFFSIMNNAVQVNGQGAASQLLGPGVGIHFWFWIQVAVSEAKRPSRTVADSEVKKAQSQSGYDVLYFPTKQVYVRV